MIVNAIPTLMAMSTCLSFRESDLDKCNFLFNMDET
jgi:hypothetical protein